MSCGCCTGASRCAAALHGLRPGGGFLVSTAACLLCWPAAWVPLVEHTSAAAHHRVLPPLAAHHAHHHPLLMPPLQASVPAGCACGGARQHHQLQRGQRLCASCVETPLASCALVLLTPLPQLSGNDGMPVLSRACTAARPIQLPCTCCPAASHPTLPPPPTCAPAADPLQLWPDRQALLLIPHER